MARDQRRAFRLLTGEWNRRHKKRPPDASDRNPSAAILVSASATDTLQWRQEWRPQMATANQQHASCCRK